MYTQEYHVVIFLLIHLPLNNADEMKNIMKMNQLASTEMLMCSPWLLRKDFSNSSQALRGIRESKASERLF